MAITTVDYFTLNPETGGSLKINLYNHWVVGVLDELQLALNAVPLQHYRRVTLDASKLAVLDTSCAWLLLDFLDRCKKIMPNAEIENLAPKPQIIFQLVAKKYHEDNIPYKKSTPLTVTSFLEHVGRYSAKVIYQQFMDWIEFVGHTFSALFNVIRFPHRLRYISIARHIDEAGVSALPIISLMVFLISIVLAYQGATQLSKFGADIFTVDLVAISLLREMGVLMVSIMIAGRSGSAFAAEIGVMKVNEEIDAMRTLGLNPFELLVIPRVLALIIVMPLLTFLADFVGLLGSSFISIFLLKITVSQFFDRVSESVSMWSFWIGIIKAPVFAFLIASIGCMKGMQASGSAEAVGIMTTAAVVESIFLVLLADALFSILFSHLGI